jgi:predicted alpha/beta-fold hydrolase
MDMRAFGQTKCEIPGLISDPALLMSDSVTFLRAYKEKYGCNKPFVLYGYSLGVTFQIGTYLNLLERDRELGE